MPKCLSFTVLSYPHTPVCPVSPMENCRKSQLLIQRIINRSFPGKHTNLSGCQSCRSAQRQPTFFQTSGLFAMPNRETLLRGSQELLWRMSEPWEEKQQTKAGCWRGWCVYREKGETYNETFPKQPTKATKQRWIGTVLARKAVASIIMHTNDNGCMLNFIVSTF